jgi:hypothetical protein
LLLLPNQENSSEIYMEAIGLKKRIKQWMWDKPRLYFPLLRILHLLHRIGFPMERIVPVGAIRIDRIATRRTAIVIEGFERSANTFAQQAFEDAQTDPVEVAHHLHVPAQVVAGCRLGIPTIVLIRKPQDAVVSDLIRGGRELSAKNILMRLSDWINFYSPLVELRTQFIVASFEEVTKDFGAIIEAVNRKWGQRFCKFDHTDENVKRVFEAIDQRNSNTYNAGRGALEHMVARPSKDRQAVARSAIETINLDQKVRSSMEKANDLYLLFVPGHGATRNHGVQS